jgi:single-stranded DNA-binding protein
LGGSEPYTRVLVTGTLHRDPVTRTAKTGKAFVTALMRSETQGETLWVNAVAFDEAAQTELLRLKAGEALTIQGAMKAGVYEKNGEQALRGGVVETARDDECAAVS